MNQALGRTTASTKSYGSWAYGLGWMPARVAADGVTSCAVQPESLYSGPQACSTNCPPSVVPNDSCNDICPRMLRAGDPLQPSSSAPFNANASAIFNGTYNGSAWGPPLWQVDLGATMAVDRVLVFGRSGQTWLFQARVGPEDSFSFYGPSVSTTSLEGDLKFPLPNANIACASGAVFNDQYLGADPAGPTSIPCGGLHGRYVSLLSAMNYMSLCEVQVFAWPLDEANAAPPSF